MECLRADLHGVLNVSEIFHRNCARSQDHEKKRSIFAFFRYMEREGFRRSAWLYGQIF
jgi:hypothetical protein